MLVLALVFCALVAASRGEVDQQIVDGEDATYGDHPYICSLQVPSGSSWFHICGCVIWSPTRVITAAHCVSGAASRFRIVVGLHRMNNADAHQVAVSVSSYTNHPQYNGNAAGFPNDISVMRLASTLTFNSHVSSITFASSGNFAGQTCQLTGWGRLSGGGSTPNILQKVDIGKITNLDCSSRWSGISGATINAGHACFYLSGKSACSGDSGGPATCGTGSSKTLVGITSWGISSCSGAYPSVYTRVSHFYSWIVGEAGSQ